MPQQASCTKQSCVQSQLWRPDLPSGLLPAISARGSCCEAGSGEQGTPEEAPPATAADFDRTVLKGDTNLIPR